MDRGYNIFPWCEQFETLLDKQLDHFWRKPSTEHFSKDRGDWEVMNISIKKRIKYIISILNRMEPEIVDNVDDISSLLKSAISPKILQQMDPIFAMISA